MLVVAVGLAACTPPGPPPPPAPEGTAVANCMRELRWRSGGTARITKVNIFEEQRGIISAAGLGFGLGAISYGCFTNAQGEVVNVSIDRRFD